MWCGLGLYMQFIRPFLQKIYASVYKTIRSRLVSFLNIFVSCMQKEKIARSTAYSYMCHNIGPYWLLHASDITHYNLETEESHRRLKRKTKIMLSSTGEQTKERLLGVL